MYLNVDFHLKAGMLRGEFAGSYYRNISQVWQYSNVSWKGLCDMYCRQVALCSFGNATEIVCKILWQALDSSWLTMGEQTVQECSNGVKWCPFLPVQMHHRLVEIESCYHLVAILDTCRKLSNKDLVSPSQTHSCLELKLRSQGVYGFSPWAFQLGTCIQG